MRTMYDAIDALALPPGGDLYAGYVDGSWPSANAISARFPTKLVIRTATAASTNDGVELDVEQGDATPEEAVNWVLMRRAAGVDPTVYCNKSTWPAVRGAFATHDVPEPHYRIAAYVSDPTRPPASIPPGAVALQWYDFGGYDANLVADYWPGVDPAQTPPAPPVPPVQLEETDMLIIRVDGDPAVYGLSGGRFWHIVDKPSLQAYIDAGIKQVRVSAAEVAAIKAAA